MAELTRIEYLVIGRATFDTISPWQGMRRCTVLDNGTVNYYLDPNDSTKKADGTASNLTGVDGQVMVEIPKFWWKWEVGTVEAKRTFRWYISDVAKEGFVIHPAFFRDRNNDKIAEEVPFRYYSAYMGFTNGSKLESRSGVKPTATQAIGVFRAQAQSRGNGWSLVDYNLVHAVQLLYLLEYGHFDSQTKIGKGYTEGNSASTTIGSTNAYGNKSFGETTGKKQMSYRGIEDFYGNCYYWIDGLFSDANRNILIGNQNFNNTGVGYTNYGQGTTADISGYISDIQDNQTVGFIVKSGGGNATSKLYDLNNLKAGSLPVFGSDWNDGSSGGAFQLNVSYSAANSYSSVSARIAY